MKCNKSTQKLFLKEIHGKVYPLENIQTGLLVVSCVYVDSMGDEVKITKNISKEDFYNNDLSPVSKFLITLDKTTQANHNVLSMVCPSYVNRFFISFLDGEYKLFSEVNALSQACIDEFINELFLILGLEVEPMPVEEELVYEDLLDDMEALGEDC